MQSESKSVYLFFFHDTATTAIYTLSLHDALPIYRRRRPRIAGGGRPPGGAAPGAGHVDRRAPRGGRDRKSTRLNSSHQIISYAVFCLKKKTNERSHNIFQLTLSR